MRINYPENSQITQKSAIKSGGVIPTSNLFNFGMRQYQSIKSSLSLLEEFALKTLDDAADNLNHDISDLTARFGSPLKVPAFAYPSPITLQPPSSPFHLNDLFLRFVHALGNEHVHKIKTIQLESFLSKVVDEITPRLGGNLKILKVLDEPKPLVVNPNALRKIVTELLLNSAEEMAEDGEIKISTDRLPIFEEHRDRLSPPLPEGYYAAVIVVDEGGVIKEPESRLPSRLALVCKMAKENQGAVSTDNLPDGHRMIVVYFPLCKKDHI